MKMPYQSEPITHHLEFPGQRFEETMRQVLGTSSPTLAAALAHVTTVSGKRLRPQLVYLSAAVPGESGTGPQAVGGGAAVLDQPTTDVAVAAELIHLASLIHDDILDGASQRHGQAALHTLRGPGQATLVGDFLFSRAFSLLAAHSDLGVVETMTEAICSMCEGELEQRAHLFDLSLTEERYLAHITKKTASLMAACTRAGAQVARLPDSWQEHLAGYGLDLGCAFQIVDDILDLAGDGRKLGKPVRSDLWQGIITLPVIYALQHPRWGPELGAILRDGATTPHRGTPNRGASHGGTPHRSTPQRGVALELVRESGGLKRAWDTARALFSRACGRLAHLPLTPARVALEKLGERIFTVQVPVHQV